MSVPQHRRSRRSLAFRPLPDMRTSCALLDHDTLAQHRALFRDLIPAADSAIHRAKRCGGNQLHRHGLLRAYGDEV
jgi:hypothetical protein